MNYAPRAAKRAVVEPGEFPIGVIGLDHGHINGMTHGLEDAGAQVLCVYDPDAEKVAAFCERFPGVGVARSAREVLEHKDVRLIASAAVPSERGPLGLRVLDHGKHYLSDKTPFTTLSQLAAAREKVKETGLIWSVCYSERLQNESAVRAGGLVREGAIGEVLQVIGLGPHRLNPETRPEWFWKRETTGGILTDIGSHQIEQFLYYAGARDARVLHSKVANYANPEHPEFEDFGDATLVADNGATNYFRVDWFTPDGLGVWGDGRTVILGSEGYIELRKYIDVARENTSDHLFLVDGRGEQHLDVRGTVGFPFFGDLILDCLNGTENAMPQDHTFKAAELCLIAQRDALHLDASPCPT
jgi:predicted dehydrogenase